MSTLKVNKLRDTAGSADAITLDPNGGAVLAGVTTMTTARVTSGIVTNTFIVGAGVTISESGIEASGIGITCANINGTQIGGRRNIIINGAMNVAQRGTSSTSTNYQTVDRFACSFSGTDEAPTQSQHTLTSSDTGPYGEGFRKSFHIQNGNQTSGAGAADYIRVAHPIEAQDIANSGWDYTSASSFITFQFWIKSSVAQSFKVEFYADDGTAQVLSIDTGSLTADTWTKVIKNIPGNSNLTFNNDNGEGLHIRFLPFFGTDFTNNSVTEDAWAAYSGSTRTKDNTTTWYTTNDATFEITGVQLEVGPQATPFEHRSFGEELSLCQRYFYKTYNYSDAPGTATFVGAQHGRNFDPNAARSAVPIYLNFPVRMRTTPTLTWYAGDGQSGKYSTGSTVGGTNLTTEKSVGTSIDESETGIYHANFTEDVPAANLYAYHVLAEAEL